MLLFCCQTSKAAGVRRMAEAQLRDCLARVGQNSIAREICKQESFAYCLKHMPANHLEKTCGLGGIQY